jgi:hypothetical protein
MSMAGWYPDPGGRPGRYRYWDGRRWSEQTSADPANPPPGSGSRPRSRPDDHPGHNPALAFGIAALALAIVVISTVLIIRRAADSSPIGAPVAPTASGWDHTAVPRGATAGNTTPSNRGACSGGSPSRLAPHPMDGRVHGGRLSMMRVQGYSSPEPDYMLSWMDDAESIGQTTEPGWQSLFAVGEVQRTSVFDSLRDATHVSMTCALHTGWYLDLSGTKDIRDEPIVVDGHQAWILTAKVYDDSPKIKVAGDQLTFVAVNDGRTDAYSVWCGMVPLGDGYRLALDVRVLRDLKVGS